MVGLGNALMDALVLLDEDNFLEKEGLNKGIMHPVRSCALDASISTVFGR